MPDETLAAQIAETVYGLEVRQIERLPPHFDWRGLFRVEDATGDAWLVRLLRGPEAVDGLSATAQLLTWLARNHYPAPVVRLTTMGQEVGLAYSWASLALSYVAGTVVEQRPAPLGALAQALGRLHSLPLNTPTAFAPGHTHPDAIATAARQLAQHGSRVLAEFRPLVHTLQTALDALAQQSQPALCLVHGDCWYQNAIQTADGAVVLIDWDLAGAGLALLDLGNLLLTAHFDFSRPLQLEADEENIAAMIRGYGRQRHLSQNDVELLAPAMQFLLAYQLGSYVADDALVRHPEFPFVLQKLEARSAATQAIAEIAARYAIQ
jgi:Ser/Thr protein kinase RdoA (MazF antagonist)